MKTEVDGITFDSKKEARRWGELQLLLRAGEISCLQRQVRYDLSVKGVVIGHYVADFVYLDQDSDCIVEDVKGFRTPLYNWKKKHFQAQYRVALSEI